MKKQTKLVAFLATLTAPFAFMSNASAWTVADITSAFTDGAAGVTAAQGGWLTLMGLIIGVTLIARLFKA